MITGGLAWTSAEVGSSLAAMGLSLVLFQFFIYETLIKSCCQSGVATTYFRLVIVSSIAVSLLYDMAHLSESFISKELILPNFNTIIGGNGNGGSAYNTSRREFMNDTESNTSSMMTTIIKRTDMSVQSFLRRKSESNISSSPSQDINLFGHNFHVVAISNSSLHDTNHNSNNISIINNMINPNIKANTNRSWIVYLTIVVILALHRIGTVAAFTSIGMVVNDSVDQQQRGTLNGLIMTFGSLGNAFGPIFGSYLYATVLDFPYSIWANGRIVFIIGSISFLLIAICSRFALGDDKH